MARVLALLLVLLLFAVPAWAAGVTVAVNAEATVSGPVMTLGELAAITGEDQQRVKTLNEVKLGSAPPPGQKMVLTRDMLGARLASAGADYSNITWQVPPTFVVTTAAQTVSGERLLAIATEAVQGQVGGNGDNDVTVAAIGSSPDIQAPLGRLDIKAEIPGGVRYNAPTIAAVIISADGRPFTTVNLRFTVKAYQQLVVAARNIAVHEEITADNVREERREVGRISGYITELGKVVGLTARRPMLAGTPLTEAMVDKPVMVKRGATVNILVQVGDMIVAAGGLAMQAGREGELIRVQNVTSKRMVTARVVDRNTVQVKIYGGR